MQEMLGLNKALRAFVSIVCFLGLQNAWAVSNTVVISQVYGAGGNSGAVLNQDYVELFNNGTTPVSLNGWTLQYRSSTGASAVPSTEIAPLPNVTLQPGQFYLVAASAVGANGTAITADAQAFTGTGSSAYLNLAGGAGQVALVNSTTPFAAGCAVTDPSIVDFVGYGSGTTCFEGTGPTGTLSSTLAAFRKAVCTDTDNNAVDFSTAAPAPRNSSTALQPCGGGSTQSFALTSVSATPNTVNQGSTTLLTARITPATNPASTGIGVTVDLSGVGGSSTQPLYDDGTHGDPTAGDNVFNDSATIGGTATGAVTLNFTATDAQLHSSKATATLTIQPTTSVLPIHTIQAGAPNSAYLGKVVTTTGIVTAIRSGGFYLQARDVDQDSDTTTSEAIYVLGTNPASVIVGNQLNVTGTVQLSSNSASTPATEIGGTVTITVGSTANPLPAPLTLKAADDSPSGGFAQFLKFQSMRFLVPSFITTAPTGGNLTENTETVTSNGEFWGVVSGVTRPFVESGISVLETQLPSGPTYCTTTVTTNCVPRFDGNPELMLIESTGLGGAPLDVTANQTIANLLGIVDFTTNFGEFLLDKTAPGTLGAPMTFLPVPVAAANEFTVGSMNIERFYSDQAATGAVTLTTPAYQRRLAKVSLLLRNVQRMPDIIGLQEVGTIGTLNDISARISSDAIAAGQPDPKYSTCLFSGNDSSGINTAFLVKTTRVTVVDCTQFGKSTTFTNSTGVQATLNDRPPLVLRATVNIPGYAAFPVTVISNHLRSLNGIDDTSSTGATVRLKKEAQDEFLANLIQGYQANGDHVVSVGDYNSFAFNDGYVDNLGVIKGTPSPASQVVVGPSSSYVAPTPVLTDLESTVADPLQRYDYSYIGNAQTLDHIVVTQNLVAGAHIGYSHEDADFPLIQYNDATTPQSSSDHDGLVAFFPLLSPGQTSRASLTPASMDFGSVAVGSSSAPSLFTLTNTGNTSINVNSITASGDFSRTATTCGATLAASATCTISIIFTPSTNGSRAGTLLASTSAVSNTNLTSSLTGSGITAGASVALTPSSAAFGTLALGATSAAQTFTLTNSGASAATIASITAAGDYARTTTCGATLASLSSCTVSVTFTPTVTGIRNGTLTVTTSGSVTPLVASLSGTGTAQATLSPASATFPATLTTATSAAQAFTLTNTAGTALTLSASAISVTGDYLQTNTCGTTLAAGASCTVSVSFKPAVAGTRTGTLTVVPTLGTVSTTLTASLTGTGQAPPDFTLTPTSQTGTLSLGTNASTVLTLTPVGGYTGTVTLTCTGAPAGSTCTVSPTSVALGAISAGANTVSVSVNITTSKTGAGFTSTSPPSMLLALFGSLGTLLVLISRRAAADKSILRGTGLLLAILGCALYTSGCASNTAAKTSTPAGTYIYTVTATDGTTTHASTYTLTVQP